MVAERIDRDRVHGVVNALIEWLQPHTERLEVAGSYRRQSETVKDIEVVCLRSDKTLVFLDQQVGQRTIEKALYGEKQTARWGAKYRGFIYQGLKIEVFLADEDNYGAVLWLRTGPGDANARLMSWLKRTNAPLRLRDGYWQWYDQRLATPDEKDVFALLNIPWIRPDQRTAERYGKYLNHPKHEWPDFRLYVLGAQSEAQQALPTVTRFPTHAIDVPPKIPEPMRVWWERAEMPLVAYRCYNDQIGSMPTVTRLPYSQLTMLRRVAYGNDVPDWWQPDFAVLAQHPELHTDYFLQRPEDREPFFVSYPVKGETMLKIDTAEKLKFTPDDFASSHVAVVGNTGSGKSVTIAKLVEQLCGLLPFTIVDIEGEYRGLRCKYDNILIVGESPHCDLKVSYLHIASLVRFSYEQKVSVILDFSHYRDIDKVPMYDWLETYFRALWNLAFDRREPYKIVLEEAPSWIRQGDKTDLSDILVTIGERGRKRGLTYLFSAQRIQQVNINVREHTELLFMHRVVHGRTLDAYCDVIPDKGQKLREIKEEVRGLDNGEVIVVHRDMRERVRMQMRETPHIAATPKIGEPPLVIEILPLSEKIASEIEDLGDKYPPVDVISLQAKIRDLTKQLARQSAAPEQSETGKEIALEMKQLREENERLKADVESRRKTGLRLSRERDNAVETVMRERQENETQLQAIKSERNRYETIIRQIEAIIAGVIDRHGDVVRTELAPAIEKAQAAHTKLEKDESGDYRTEGQIKYAQGRQRSAFQTILREVERSAMHRSMLTTLLNNAPKRYTLNELSRLTGYADSTMSRNPPLLLVQEGLICRERQGREYVYWSEGHKVFEECYPDLDAIELAEELTGTE